MAIAWHKDQQFYPDYYVGLHELDKEVPEAGREGPWWSLPFTPVGSKLIPELSTAKPKHTHLWVAMANLEKAFNPSIPHPRWPNDTNTDETDPEGGSRITDHIEHLSFQKFSYDPEAEPDTERLQPVLLNHITLPTPTPDWGWSGYLLYPYHRCQVDPQKKRRCASVGQVKDSYGVADWPDWADWGFMGDCPPGTKGKVKGGGWLSGMMWHHSDDGSVLAIPQWSHSPLLCVINPETGQLAWKKEGWAEYNDSGSAAYELFSPLLVLDDQVLVHYERYEWELVDHKRIDPLQFQAFEEWFYCRPSNTHTDVIVGDGETTTFELSADAGGVSYERGKGLVDTSHWHPQVTIDGCRVVYEGPRPFFFVDFASFNPKILMIFQEPLPEGVEVEVKYSVKKDCAYLPADTVAETVISPPTGGSSLGSGAGGLGQAWQECCESDREHCWWKDLYVCQYYPQPSSCYGPHPCGDGSTWTTCPFTGANDEWEGRYCEVVNVHIGPCQHKKGIAPPDVSRITDVLTQVRPRLDDLGLQEVITLQTPMKWTHGYRWYNVKTGARISEDPFELRSCDYKPKKYKTVRLLDETHVLQAQVTAHEEGGAVIGEQGVRVNADLEELGENESFFWAWEASYTVQHNKNPYNGCACFPEGCCSTWGGEEWDFAAVALDSPITFSNVQAFIDPVDTYRSRVNKTECGEGSIGGNFDSQVGAMSATKTYRRWGIVVETEDLPVEQSVKAPHLTYNAVIDASGTGVYFLPGRTVPENAPPNTTPGPEEPTGKAPVINDIDPSNNNTGAVDPPQNIEVEITGKNFVDVIGVFFGGTVATTFTVDSPTKITCTTPGGIPEEDLPETVNVTVVTPEGTSNAVTFTYMAGGIIEG